MQLRGESEVNQEKTTADNADSTDFRMEGCAPSRPKYEAPTARRPPILLILIFENQHNPHELKGSSVRAGLANRSESQNGRDGALRRPDTAARRPYQRVRRPRSSVINAA